MSEPFIAEIVLFGGNFAPRGWAFCSGQLLAITSNSALFSLIGTIYGGDGRTTFGLPDLRGRMAIGPGNGPGLPSYRLGQRGGTERETLTLNQIPAHKHGITLHGESQSANSANPNGRMLGGTSVDIYADVNASTDLPMAASSIIMQDTGGNQAHNNLQPFIGLNYIIALQGIFPSRN